MKRSFHRVFFKLMSFIPLVGWLALAGPGGRAAMAGPCTHGLYLNGKHWIKTERSDAELDQLAERVAGSRMGRIYLPANSVQDDDYPRVQRLLAALRRHQPGVQILGFIGRSVSGGHYPDPSGITRRLIALGLDGVQLDYEPIPKRGDPRFLVALAQARAAAPGKLLSVAGHWLTPDGTLEPSAHPRMIPGKALLEWDAAFYAQVLARVDDVMVMNYDTTLKTPEAYTAFTRWQYDHLAALPLKKETTLTIGLPTQVWGRNGMFDRKAENFRVGLEALRTRLASGGCGPISGITLFEDSGMKEEDWVFFRKNRASP